MGAIELLVLIVVLIGVIYGLNARGTSESRSRSESSPGFFRALFQGHATLTCWHCGAETDSRKQRCQHCDRELK